MIQNFVSEIDYGLSAFYGFSYIDTKDGLADLLFDHLKVSVMPDREFSFENDPYRVIMCKVPRTQRDAFLHAVELLPSLMAYAGNDDYEEYCTNFFRFANRWMDEHEALESRQLQ